MLPADVVLTESMNTTDIIELSINNIINSVVQGALLAVLVLLVFLRSIKSTIIIGITIPVSLVITLGVMKFSGFSLNMMTLAGLSLGVGMLVDNSIVILENIYSYRAKGAKAKAAAEDVEIVGGDITGADKIYISVAAVGSTTGRRISSRANAKIGQKVIVSGNHGSSGAGLKELFTGKKESKFITTHLQPTAQRNFAQKIAANIKEDYAMMDTSDGLMDALSAIASESNVLLSIDFDKIPYDKDLEKFVNWQDLIFYGGEDYQLVATVPDTDIYGTVIGEVKAGNGVEIHYTDKTVLYTKSDVEKKLFKHFKEKE